MEDVYPCCSASTRDQLKKVRLRLDYVAGGVLGTFFQQGVGGGSLAELTTTLVARRQFEASIRGLSDPCFETLHSRGLTAGPSYSTSRNTNNALIFERILKFIVYTICKPRSIELEVLLLREGDRMGNLEDEEGQL